MGETGLAGVGVVPCALLTLRLDGLRAVFQVCAGSFIGIEKPGIHLPVDGLRAQRNF